MNFLRADVEIKVDDSKLDSQLAKAKKAVVKTVDRIKNSFKKMGISFKNVFSRMVKTAKWAALAIAGAFVLVTRRAMKQEDAINRLNITLKATGHAAGFSAKQLLEHAASLQKVTRFGDETITAMQTMLLTFKNIKGDEFKRATEAALDMATAEAAVSGRSVDLTATSIRLGKALNDPILGITALSRVGVQFTESQKAMIREMVEVGDVAGAQNVILKELEGQFGGMSRDVNTASGALKQMWNVLGDVAEVIGNAFLPGIRDTAIAVKEWADRNKERIGEWAETAAAYMSYVKDVLWTFAKFLATDWKAGVKAGLDITLELFKGFGKALLFLVKEVASRAADVFVESLSVKMAKGVAGVIQKIDMAVMGAGYQKWAQRTGAVKPEHFKVTTPEVGPTIGEEMKKIALETSERIKEVAPPELTVAFEEPLIKLKSRLEEVGTTAEEIEEPMTRALVEPPKKSMLIIDQAIGKLKQWASAAKNIWGNMADIATSALDGVSDSLANLFLKGKADFNALAESILMDMTRMIIKAQMAQALGALLPGLFGGAGGGGGFGLIPGLQSGGLVKKTGLAVVHKGEEFSGVEGGRPKRQEQQAVTFNMNVNAIDAAGTFQFLNRNKRAIATMMQGQMSANHPLRRSKNGFK